MITSEFNSFASSTKILNFSYKIKNMHVDQKFKQSASGVLFFKLDIKLSL